MDPMTKLPRGAQILMHYNADNMSPHDVCLDPSTQVGFVTSGPRWDGSYHCRYWNKQGELRTKANSEATPYSMIVVMDTYPQDKINKALEEYC